MILQQLIRELFGDLSENNPLQDEDLEYIFIDHNFTQEMKNQARYRYVFDSYIIEIDKALLYTVEDNRYEKKVKVYNELKNLGTVTLKIEVEGDIFYENYYDSYEMYEDIKKSENYTIVYKQENYRSKNLAKRI